jgi:sirohydrochlorin ferrochelatase
MRWDAERTATVNPGPCSCQKVVVLEAFLLEGLLIDHITKAEENLL